MRRRFLITAFAAAALIGSSLVVDGVERTQAQGQGNAAPAPQAADHGNAPPNPPGLNHRPACPGPVARGEARCHLQIRTDIEAQAMDARGRLTVSGPRGGYYPADLRQAYALTAASGSAGSGQVVAIVDAFDHPKAENDLGVYRRQFGLPPCTTANGCFRKVNQQGVQGAYPRFNAGWANEIALDIQMVSAICPNCKILLVEANDNSYVNLAQAVDTAAAYSDLTHGWPRASAISNSYGGSEYGAETTDQSHYNHPGIAITVSSGDNGYGVEYPAASQYVTAVGGTTLNRASNARTWSETVWGGAGSGCSAYIAKPVWQTDTGCANRTLTDVSAVADPNTGVAAYSSYACLGIFACWGVVGGTSVAAPIVASVYALAGHTSPTTGTCGGYQYCANYTYRQPTTSFSDVSSGSNGTCGTSSSPTWYLCNGVGVNNTSPYNGVAGYDGPTGLGTPNGTAGF